MDNHSWLMIKSFHKSAFVVQVLYIHLPVSPSCVFDVNVKESPFDAVQIFGISPVYGSGRDHFSRRPFLGPRVDAPCILQGILIHCNLCGLEFLVLCYASVV